ncbi:hypothetical protein FB45DRAFT_898690 [Roridomyces roridus]|uniref:DUF6699 domain-containing protein n=1 Tax=Roridomyces roridus TaxID=1738132 RepID=A0AAD7CC74_9AGAR|nr:hypothetical protein FB45DRAFT_898690 [Roridomyces roridus]
MVYGDEAGLTSAPESLDGPGTCLARRPNDLGAGYTPPGIDVTYQFLSSVFRRNTILDRTPLRGWGVPVPAVAVVYDEHCLAPRPEDWRAGYNPPWRAATDSSLSSLFRRNTTLDDAGDYVDTKKRKLADPLVYSATRPLAGIAYDMRLSPDGTRASGPFKPRALGDLMQPAVTPATTWMRLFHPRLPWWVDVRQATPNQGGVTLYDVLRSLHDELDRAIGSHHFFTEWLVKKDRYALMKAFKERCALQGGEVRSDVNKEMLKGVKRVDYLGTECVFVGLVKKNGIWEIKTEHS